MNQTRKNGQPNLFIIGAPKCGTTSLYDYLVRYPTIAGGLHKEPHYFNADHPEFRHATSLDDYLKFYDDVDGSTVDHVIDASTNYIYSDVAIDQILAYQAEAKFIVMFRHPLDLIRSLHEHFLFRQIEPESDFATAWSLGPMRDRAPQFIRSNSKSNPYPGHLSYQDAGKLGAHFSGIADKIDPSRLLVIFFEDIISDRSRVIDQVLEFIGVQRDPTLDIEKRNRAKQMKSRWLNRWLLYPPPWLQSLKNVVKRAVSADAIRKLNLYSRISGSQKREPLPVSLEQDVIAFFKDDIQQLAQITGRDLEHWLIPREREAKQPTSSNQ